MMDIAQKKLWRSLRNLYISTAGAEYTFNQRLQHENGWSEGYTERVVEEYRRFLFLCAVCTHGVTPSEQVDQVWHLHLTYTINYWDYLCANVLGFQLHHGPTKGGKTENVKYKDQYLDTLDSYKRYFDEEPPFDIWPSAQLRFQDMEFKRINLNNTYAFKKPQFYHYRYALLSMLSGAIAIVIGYGEWGWILISLGILISLAVFYIRSQRTGNEGSQYGCDDSGGCGAYTTWKPIEPRSTSGCGAF